MDVAPPRTQGILIGFAILLAGVGAASLGLSQLARAAISPALLLWAALPMVGAAAAGLALYRSHGLITARYVLNRNGLGVRWGLAVEEIPLPEVRIERPHDLLRARLRPQGAVRWPGCVVGVGEVEGLGRVEFFSTRGQAGMLLVTSPRGILAISPPDPEAFLRAFVAAARQGALDPIQARSARPDLFPARLWRDPVARPLLFAGIALPLVLLGFLGLRAASLPAAVPFGFDALGNPDSLVPPGRLLLLPLIGGLCWACDLALGSALYRRGPARNSTPAGGGAADRASSRFVPRRGHAEGDPGGDRSLAYAIWALAVVVGLLLWGAALNLLAAA